MAKKHPPGGEGLSHSPAVGGNHPSKATCLSSVVNSWQKGPFSPPGYVRQSEDQLREPPFQSFQGAVSGVRVYAQDYLGAGISPRRNQDKS